MVSQDRYLRFANIDMKDPDIHARCSQCGQDFSAVPKPNERVDDVLLRMRVEYNAHKCKSYDASATRH